jgi:hypothetical protein
MNTYKVNSFPDSLAKILSVIFHPLFVPVYGLLIIFSAPTLFMYMPFSVKKLLLLIILVNNVILPISLMPFFIHRNIISSWTLSDRKERLIPLIMTTILYAATSYIIFGFHIPFFLKSFIFASFFLSAMVTVITFWWKISLHSVGAGALLAMILILSFRMDASLVWHIISAIIAGSLVLTSRLSLYYHNPRQVWLGFFSGFFGLTFLMILFQ